MFAPVYIAWTMPGDVPLAVAGARARRRGAAGRRRLVRPRHAALGPGAAELEGLERAPARGRLRVACAASRSATEQPCGIAGRLNRTRARRLPPLLDITLRIESEPLFDAVLPESIQASAFAVSVCCGPQLTVGLWIVHV